MALPYPDSGANGAEAMSATSEAAVQTAPDRMSQETSGLDMLATSVGALILGRDMRHVQAVQDWLADPLLQRYASDSDCEAARKVAECRDWLVHALEYERVHGRGSLLDRTHPFWVSTMEPALRRAREILQEEKNERSQNTDISFPVWGEVAF